MPLGGAAVAAPFAYLPDLVRPYLQVLEELLMIVWSGVLELVVPAVHFFVSESSGAHDGGPFVFRHDLSPVVCFAGRFQQADNGLLLAAQNTYFLIDLEETAFEDCRRRVTRGA